MGSDRACRERGEGGVLARMRRTLRFILQDGTHEQFGTKDLSKNFIEKK